MVNIKNILSLISRYINQNEHLTDNILPVKLYLMVEITGYVRTVFFYLQTIAAGVVLTFYQEADNSWWNMCSSRLEIHFLQGRHLFARKRCSQHTLQGENIDLIHLKSCIKGCRLHINSRRLEKCFRCRYYEQTKIFFLGYRLFISSEIINKLSVTLIHYKLRNEFAITSEF